jgi:DNA-binding transcriptional MerR regulator
MANPLRVREFAELAGVTVKALHHYDRLGLLKPARTAAGYRVYSAADFERLEQIVALRFLGIPLKQMGALLGRGAGSLESTFRQQREALEDKRRLLGRAIDALAEAERAAAAGTPPAVAILRRVIGIIAMQDIDVMRKYFSDDTWAAGRQHFDDWPSQEWQTLYRDVAAALDADPAGAQAQALADRWLALALGSAPGSGMRAGLHRAWADREHWPPVLKRRIAEFDIERAARFINEAMWVRWDADREAQRRSGTAPPRVSERRILLYRDCAAILGESPDGASAQSMVARWRAIVEDEADGDEATRAAMLTSFSGRVTWPAGLKRYWASLYRMDTATWERVADFIERANAVSAPSAPRSPSGSAAPPPT